VHRPIFAGPRLSLASILAPSAPGGTHERSKNDADCQRRSLGQMDKFESQADYEAAVKQQQGEMLRLLKNWISTPFDTPENEAARRAYSDAVERMNKIYKAGVRKRG
jgi:hypothetical protein